MDALENLATESRNQMQSQFADVTSAACEKLEELSDQIILKESGSLKKPAQEIFRKFLNQRKRDSLNLQESLDNYLSTFPVLGFNSAKYDLNLLKSYLIPFLIIEKGLQPRVIKQTNQFISFKFGNVQMLDIMKFIGGSTTLNSFLKAYESFKTKNYSPMNGSTVHQNLTMNNFHDTQIFSASSEIKILWKPILKSSKIYFLLIIPKKMPCEK